MAQQQEELLLSPSLVRELRLSQAWLARGSLWLAAPHELVAQALKAARCQRPLLPSLALWPSARRPALWLATDISFVELLAERWVRRALAWKAPQSSVE